MEEGMWDNKGKWVDIKDTKREREMQVWAVKDAGHLICSRIHKCEVEYGLLSLKVWFSLRERNCNFCTFTKKVGVASSHHWNSYIKVREMAERILVKTWSSQQSESLIAISSSQLGLGVQVHKSE